ncbi:MAG: ribosome biogenesis GTPase Der [Candidatus Nanopelagicales bacterium]|nr:ribosome biogenesis GTPase Der [Candidatus Nanopelagicales bacterium]MDZ4249988.1 ribosome biogenesis GTPase Der [Candidatus Nanopelagicales bacterium]
MTDDQEFADLTPIDGEWVSDSDTDEGMLAEAMSAARTEQVLEAEPTAEELPVVAVVGRPNVGKSTLVNRILGRREAVVEDVPGVTRDRVAYQAEWAGRRFIALDTGGWDRTATGRAASVAAQAERAMREADVTLFVVDATVGPTSSDEDVVKVLRSAKKPMLLVANRVDNSQVEAEAASLWSLGLGEPHPVSALHGRGSGDLLDAVVALLPQRRRVPAVAGPHRIALVGRPNVGKSSLLNRLAGQSRSVVHEVAGTTVDPVDEVVHLGGRSWVFVDTAGLRRRVREAHGHEFYASLRTRTAIERAELAVVVLDAGEVLSEQDVNVANMVVDSGRALIIAYNKWDLVDEERRRYLERDLERDLGFISWAPRVNVSALTGRRVDKLVPAFDAALAGWETRVPTGRLNSFLNELAARNPHPVRGGKQPRVLFGTQASIRPPTFVLFTSGFLEAGYRRFIERSLREEFGFVGTPIRIGLRVRTKRQR